MLLAPRKKHVNPESRPQCTGKHDCMSNNKSTILRKNWQKTTVGRQKAYWQSIEAL
jgi:hypothetical protein